MTDNKIENLQAGSRRSLGAVKRVICDRCARSRANAGDNTAECGSCAVMRMLEMMHKEVYNIGYAVGLIDALAMLVKSAEHMAADDERRREEMLKRAKAYYEVITYEQA